MSQILYKLTLQLESADFDPVSCWSLLQPCVLPEQEDIEDEYTTSCRVSFYSTVLPDVMKRNLAYALQLYPGMHYADVLYRYPDEMYHDRFVVWSDGTAQEFITHSLYEEDGEREKVV